MLKNLGFESDGHYLNVLFDANTDLSKINEKSTICYPEQDYQKEIDLLIYEGTGRSTISHVNYLGKVHIDIENPTILSNQYFNVTFNYDQEKILPVIIIDKDKEYINGKFYISIFKY